MKTILFGAGASIPFYDPPLTTKYLTDKVLELKSWEDISQTYAKEMHLGYDFQIPSASVILDVLYRIKDIYERHGKKIDFEQLAEIIDKISSIEYDFAPDSNMLNLLLHTISARPMSLPRWWHIPFLFREVIANAIIDIEGHEKATNYNELQKKQQNFIKAIKSGDRKMSVISLNYDDCVPNSIDKIDGFDYCFTYDSDIKCDRLNVKHFLSAPYVAYFPHGHLRFYSTVAHGVSFIKHINGCKIYEAETERWYNLGEEDKRPIESAPFSYDFNTFITTGMSKDNSFNKPPYSIYYQRLAKDFAESDTIYVIGYSFGDLHVNRLIYGFLKRNEANKAFVIDKYDKTITTTEEYKDLSNIITKLQGVLSPKWDIYFDNNSGQSRPLKQLIVEGVKNANKIGYGEIFEQVVFYRKGYESFLDEYEAVITEDYHKPRCKLIQGFIDKAKAVIKPHNKKYL